MKIVFFGVGAVCSVMATLLDELSNKSKQKDINFVFVVRNIKKAQGHFFKNSNILNKSDFLEIKHFEEIFEDSKKYEKYLQNSDIFINSSTPSFNLPIMNLALKYNTNYADLASDIYKDEIISINLGISPGITNFLIGEKIHSLKNLPYEVKIKKLEINLLEEIQSKKLIFSWSPKVAIDEYKFPYFRNFVDIYPVFQEELISLKQSFPQIENLKLFVGGSEIELMKNLYQLNLFSNKYCYENSDSKISINTIIKNIVPKMKTPEIVEDYIKKKTIKYAEFSAVADIYLEILYPQNDEKIRTIESVGLSFNKYRELLKTPYSGSTYVSYPTGVAAGILIYYSLLNKKRLSGVILSENLPELFEHTVNDIIKRELGNYKINLINQIK